MFTGFFFLPYFCFIDLQELQVDRVVQYQLLESLQIYSNCGSIDFIRFFLIPFGCLTILDQHLVDYMKPLVSLLLYVNGVTFRVCLMRP